MHRIGVPLAFVGFAALRLAVVSAQDLSAIGYLREDDFLFLRLAGNILQGEWLGAYDSRTLVKGPFYSLWIAGVSSLGLPLLLAQHLLYIAASLIMARALSPMLGRVGSLVIYALLLANPMSFTDELMTRVIREGIYPAEALLVMGCAVGLFVRRERRASRMAIWSAGLGLALAALWLTREEGVWILPATFLPVAAALPAVIRGSRRSWAPRLAALLLPILLWPAGVGVVASINSRHYDVFCIVDIKSREFRSAYGALSRAGAGSYQYYVPVPESVRRQLFEVSPAFAELRPHLEGDIGRKWSFYSCDDPPCEDIAGGWLLWAVRESAELNGNYASATAAATYFSRLAAEVNAACDDGLLSCTAPRASLAPVWRNEYLLPLASGFFRDAVYTVRFAGFKAEPTPSQGSPESLELFGRITRERLATAAPSEARFRLLSLHGVGRLFQWLAPLAALLALAVYVIETGRVIRARKGSDAWIVATAFLGAVAARVLLIAMLELLMFAEALDPTYLAPAYPFILVFIAVTLNHARLIRAKERLPRAAA